MYTQMDIAFLLRQDLRVSQCLSVKYTSSCQIYILAVVDNFGSKMSWEIVKPWSKSESKPLSKQAPKSNKSPPKKEKRRIWTLG